MKIGDRVFIDGQVHHKKQLHEVSSYGTLKYVSDDACLVAIDDIGGESATVIVKSKFILCTRTA